MRRSLQQYLATGISAHAVASDEMLHVVGPVDQPAATRSDLDAMTTYLLGDKPLTPQGRRGMPTAANAPGQRHYLDLCAGCHGRDGEGVPNVAVSLRGNSSVRDADPHNLIVAILDGLPEHDFPGLARMQDMPGFGEDLDDAQVAALATWLRQRHGGPAAAVDAAAVASCASKRSRQSLRCPPFDEGAVRPALQCVRCPAAVSPDL